MPDIETSFEIDQPPGRVWTFFQDVPEVVTCMPGAVLLDRTGETTYRGKVTVRLGPVTAAFEGEATIAEADRGSRHRQDRRLGHRPPGQQPRQGEHRLRNPRTGQRLPCQAPRHHPIDRRARADGPRRNRSGRRRPPHRPVCRAPPRQAHPERARGRYRCGCSGAAPGNRGHATRVDGHRGLDQADAGAAARPGRLRHHPYTRSETAG